jgi:hypothetical protein
MKFFGILSRYRLLIAGSILVALVALFGLVGRLFMPEDMSEVDVMEPFLVEVILSCMAPISVARVGW